MRPSRPGEAKHRQLWACSDESAASAHQLPCCSVTVTTLLPKQSKVHPTSELEYPVKLYGNAAVNKRCHIGRYTYIGRNSTVSSDTVIGRYCAIARGVEVGAFGHPTDWLSIHPFQYNRDHFTPVDGYGDSARLPFDRPSGTRVGNDVWIGANAVIPRGIEVGNGAVIAAGAIVTRDVAPYEIVGGVPARHIRFRFDEPTIIKLQNLEWWNLPSEELSGLPFDDVSACLAILEAREDAAEQPSRLP